MRRRVPQYFPSKSEGGRSYALESPYHKQPPQPPLRSLKERPSGTRVSSAPLPRTSTATTTATRIATPEREESYHDQDSNTEQSSQLSSIHTQLLNQDSPARLGAIPFDQTTSLMAGEESGAYSFHGIIGSHSGGSYTESSSMSQIGIGREGSTVMTTQDMVASLLSNRSNAKGNGKGRGNGTSAGQQGYDTRRYRHRQWQGREVAPQQSQEGGFRLQPPPQGRNAQAQAQLLKRQPSKSKSSTLPPSFQPPQSRRHPELLEESTIQKKETKRYSQPKKIVEPKKGKGNNNTSKEPPPGTQTNHNVVAKKDMDSDADTNPTLKTETSSTFHQNEFFLFNSNEYESSGNDNHTVKTECWSQQHLLTDSHPFFPEDGSKESKERRHNDYVLDSDRHRQTSSKSSKNRNSSKNKNMMSPIKVLNLISPKKKKKRNKEQQPSQSKTEKYSFSRMSSRPLHKQHRHQRLISSSASTSSNVSLSSRDAIRRSKSYRKGKESKGINSNKENEENREDKAPEMKPYSIAHRIQSFGSDISDIHSNKATVASQSQHVACLENDIAIDDGHVPLEVRHESKQSAKPLPGNVGNEHVLAARTQLTSNKFKYNICHESMHLDEAGAFSVESGFKEIFDGMTKNLPNRKGLKLRSSSHDEMSPFVMKNTVNISNDVALPEKQIYNRRVKDCLTSHDEMSPIRKDARYCHSRKLSHDEMSPLTKGRNLSTERVESPNLNYGNRSNATTSTPHKSVSSDSEFEADFDKSWNHSPIKKEGSFALHVINESIFHEDNVGNEEEQKDDFIKIVAAIVIQTFFRRHLAYKVAWKRYNGVLTIQRFVHFRLEQQRYRQEEKEFVRAQTSANLQMQPYHLAATEIQSLFRGWWARECNKVDAFCATLIQRSYRSHRLRWSTHVCDAAATVIQTHWRRYTAEMSYINDFGRILMVQSICRGFIVRSRMKREERRREKRRQYHRPGRLTKRTISSVSVGSSQVLSNASTALIKNTFGQKSNTARRAHESLKKYATNENNTSVSNQVSTALSNLKTSDLIEQWKRRQKPSRGRPKRGIQFDI